MLRKPLVVIVLLLFVGLLIWLRPDRSDEPLVRTSLIMGTLVEIKIYDTDQDKAAQAASDAFAEMNRIEQVFSRHIESSEISQLSQATAPFRVSAEVAALLEQGEQIARASGGAFDIGLGRLKGLWGIESEHPHIPSAAELQEALAGTGPEAVRLEGTLVYKSRPGLQIDLGGIAKGYAVDRALQLLRTEGIHSAAVNAGGDIALIGDKEGQPWRIGIQHPRNKEKMLLTLPLRDCAVVTSGDYERFFERDGVRYHHIFDPATGQPARLCQSVTVIAPSAALADALATATFVLGPEKGKAFLERYQDVEGLIVTAAGELVKTDGLP